MADQGLWSRLTYSTPAFDYSVWRKAQQFRRPQPCTLVAAAISDDIVLKVPCFYCDVDANNLLNKEDYYEYYAHQLSDSLLSLYPGMPRCGADQVSATFKSILQEANAAHRFSCRKEKQLTTVHSVLIDIEPPPPPQEMEYEERALRDSFEEAGPKMKPASAKSVSYLMARKWIAEDEEGDRYESTWKPSDCVICMEEIDTWRRSLSMGCCHVFHKKCLVQWLRTSHFCPLCRHKMPTDDHH